MTRALIEGGVDVLTDGTDTHLVLVDLNSTGLDGQTAEDRLDQVAITANFLPEARVRALPSSCKGRYIPPHQLT